MATYDRKIGRLRVTEMTGALQRARKLIWSHPVEAERILTDAVEQKL